MSIRALFYKSARHIVRSVMRLLDAVVTYVRFKGNDVKYSSFETFGIPYIVVARGAKTFEIGTNFKMNNGRSGNPIGCSEPCSFFVDNDAELIIGNNVGMSQTAIVASLSVLIKDNVKIGGGTRIYDTDFHSLDAKFRNSIDDIKYRKCEPIIIGNNVFIGAFSIILKGVVIGDNSIVGAGSIVTKSIPANQIWAGNPAKFIRNIL